MSILRESHRSRVILVLGVFAFTVTLCATALMSCGGVSPDSDAITATESGSSETTSPEASTSGDEGEFTIVTFETEDGLVLSGRAYGMSAPLSIGQTTSWLILCHMYPADQTSWHQEALALVELGYPVMTFDFRGYGSSEGEKDIQYLALDVDAAVRYVRGAGAQEVVLVGASMGGTAGLVTAVELQAFSSFRLAGVVTLSAPVEFNGLSARQAASGIVVPLLVIAAEDDSAADAARELASLSGDHAELHIVAGSGHGTDIFAGPEAANVRQLFYDFLQQCMPIGG